MLAAIAALAVLAVAPTFVERPCNSDSLASARCGIVEVPEDRHRLQGRTIGLNVVILPGRGPKTSPPLFDIEGGPGLASTGSASFYLGEGKAYREHRDIVLVDQRGTGGSNPLQCPQLTAVEDAGRPIYPGVDVVACRNALAKHADLRLYGTREAVADLDDVRVALGYDRIDLVGISYGTTFILRYLATFPKRVRSAILISPVPADARPPRSHALVAQQALDRLFAECRAEPACHSQFNPRRELSAALAQLSSIKWAPPEAVFLEKLRRLMYAPAGAHRIPMILKRAALGDLTPFAEATRADPSVTFAEGLYLSITCGESIALTATGRVRKASAKTVFGDYRLSRQEAACREWPAVRPALDHLEPVRSAAPVLIVAGTEDPVARPSWAYDIARRLPRSRVIMVRGGGHGLAGMPGLDACFDKMALAFLDHGSTDGLDTSCVAALRPPPFAQNGKAAHP